MKWDQEALDDVSKAPTLLRPMIKRKVESNAAASGASVVTLQHVMNAKPQFAAKRTASEATAEIGLTAAEIEKVVASTPHSSVVSKSRFYEVKVCGGAYGCPRTLYDVSALSQRIIEKIEKANVGEAVESRVTGPVLRHHKFNVAISGCPNSCSQPQINDFGVQGRTRVELGPCACVDCRACVAACGEGAMTVEDCNPEIDRSKCIDCGDCAVVCPAEALIQEGKGFTVMAGGKLGRHPQLAHDLFQFTDEDTLLAALDVALDVFKNEMLPGERMADAVTRIGVEEMVRRVASDPSP
jgi:anaerobic sulfite reductase subunit C